jgi:O-antigen ligase
MMSELPQEAGAQQSERRTAMAVILLLMAYLVITSTIDTLPALGVFNAKRILQLGLFSLILAIGLLHPALRSRFSQILLCLPPVLRATSLLIVLLGVVSALLHDRPVYSLVEVAMLSLLAVTTLVVGACRSAMGCSFDRVVLASLLFLGFAVSLQELMGLLANWMLDSEFSYDQVLVRFAHPRFFNQLQTWFIPVLVAVPAVFSRNRALRWACVLVLGLNCYLLIMTAARGSILSLILSFAMIAAIAPSRAGSWFKWLAGGVVLGTAIFFSILALNEPMAPKGGLYVEKSIGRPMTHSSGRNILWRIARDEALANPWLGTGPMRYACGHEANLPSHPHNFYLQFLSEWGIPATLLLLITASWLAWRTLGHARQARFRDRPFDILALTVTGSLCAGVIHSGASGLLLMPASQVAAVLVGGWLLGLNAPASSATNTARTGSVILSIALISALALSIFAANELNQRA